MTAARTSSERAGDKKGRNLGVRLSRSSLSLSRSYWRVRRCPRGAVVVVHSRVAASSLYTGRELNRERRERKRREAKQSKGVEAAKEVERAPEEEKKCIIRARLRRGDDDH